MAECRQSSQLFQSASHRHSEPNLLMQCYKGLERHNQTRTLCAAALQTLHAAIWPAEAALRPSDPALRPSDEVLGQLIELKEQQGRLLWKDRAKSLDGLKLSENELEKLLSQLIEGQAAPDSPSALSARSGLLCPKLAFDVICRRCLELDEALGGWDEKRFQDFCNEDYFIQMAVFYFEIAVLSSCIGLERLRAELLFNTHGEIVEQRRVLVLQRTGPTPKRRFLNRSLQNPQQSQEGGAPRVR